MELKKSFMTRFVAVFQIIDVGTQKIYVNDPNDLYKCIATTIGTVSAATICFVNPTVFVSPFFHRPAVQLSDLPMLSQTFLALAFDLTSFGAFKDEIKFVQYMLVHGCASCMCRFRHE